MTDPRVTLNAETQLYGIFGNPVRHSLSPLIHNALFKKLGMNAVYLAFPIEKESLGLAFEAIRSLGIRGVNITIPFKEMAINLVDEIPEDADRCVGAINTVVNRNGRLYGFNTDVPGFLAALKNELQFNPAAKNILVLGAGGAARAAVFALAHAGAESVWIYNRTPGRAAGLQSYLSSFFSETEIESLESLDTVRRERIDLVVNATSCGMKTEDPIAFDLELLREKAFVYDLIYAPGQTRLLKMAESLGWPRANGLGMLAAQAAISFQHWTGQSKGVHETMLEVLKTCRL